MAEGSLKHQVPSESSLAATDSGFGVPIALFNFNRPLMTRRVFEIVRQIKPRRLLLVADGPRPSRSDDQRLCAEVRAILSEIDWECEVTRNFADTNMGSFKRNSTGLNWVFDSVEEAIILEDDCIPSLSFFPYCEELLERYRDDSGVGVISGDNFGFPEMGSKPDSYFFSAYAFTWGWASWRRVWKQVDLEMSWWESEAGREMLHAYLPRPSEWRYWYKLYENIYNGRMKNAWDYQLLLSCFRYSQNCAIPKVNLVSNIGFGSDATNCLDENSPLQNLPNSELEFPLEHPKDILCLRRVDKKIFTAFIRQTLLQRAINKLIKILK